MPGGLLQLTSSLAVGWAAHPRLVEYRVVVNMVVGSVVVRSALAEQPLAGHHSRGSAVPCGFRLDLAALRPAFDQTAPVHFWIGETDERIDVPPGLQNPRNGPLTVEDLLHEAHRPRPWVDGTTYVDAEAAGLQVETIVDLLYRDYLGRASDPNGLLHYSAAIRGGTLGYDDVRRGFLETDEYRLRRKYVDSAPGSIFSQKIVWAAASRDPGESVSRRTTGETVVASEIAALDGREFIAELYRRILLKEADEGGMAHYLHQLQLGVGKMAVIRTIAAELEAITAGIRVIGYEEPAPATAARVAE